MAALNIVNGRHWKHYLNLSKSLTDLTKPLSLKKKIFDVILFRAS